MSVKSELLSLLLDKKNHWLSGEMIAERLHCSRTAVWKAVRRLREDGYEIDAVQNRGYALLDGSDVLSTEEIQRYLGNNSEFFDIKVYQEIGSTNDELKAMATNDHAPEGTVIVSDYQTGGKGRLGRSFFSPKGSGLYISLLLRPEGSVIDNLILTAQAAVAVFRAVRTVTGVELSIKWVNDLYYGGKKVCGILSEGQANFETGKLDYVIVGIGINIYDPEDGFPAEIRDKAGSVFGGKETGRKADRNRMAAEIIREFYDLARKKQLDSEYIEKNIVPGHRVIILDAGKEREGFALGILPDGRLEILEEDGSRTMLVYGEVSIKLAK